MHKKKEILAFVLTAALLASGCAAPSQPEEAASPAPTETPAETLAPDNGAAPETGPEAEALAEGTVLADTEAFAVTVKAFDPAGDLGPTFTLRLENRAESGLYFTLEDVSVNDVMSDPLWGEAVPAGESVERPLHWFRQALAGKGIHYIQEVEGVLRVYDADDPSAEDIYEGPVAWSVDAEETDLPPVEEPVFSGRIEDMELFSSEALEAVIKDFSPQGEWGPSLTIYLQNHTDSTVLFFMSSVSVNGVALPTYWSTNVSAGKVAYSPCFLWQDGLDENQIEEIETLAFTFTAVDYETWSTLAQVTMTVSLEGSGEILEQNVSVPQ